MAGANFCNNKYQYEMLYTVSQWKMGIFGESGSQLVVLGPNFHLIWPLQAPKMAKIIIIWMFYGRNQLFQQ